MKDSKIKKPECKLGNACLQSSSMGKASGSSGEKSSMGVQRCWQQRGHQHPGL